MNRRNRTKASPNAAAKSTQPSKQPTQAQQPTPPAPAKPAAPVPARSARQPSAPSPPKPTPSAILRQAWNNFEPWLSARRAEKDKKVNEKMKELMSGKGKGRNGKQAAASTEDIGAFEDRLNQDLAEQAREEWLKRVGATGFDESDWTDITEAEMAKVEEAFVPQPRAKPAPEPRITPPPAAPETKPVVLPKVTAGRGRYAATVEDEDSPSVPGGWQSPGPAVPATGIIGRTRAETPAQQPRANILAGGRAAQKETLPTPESLWEMHMNKPSVPSALRTSTPAVAQEKPQAESLWDRHYNASPDSSTPPSTTVPTPDSLWETQMSKNIPQIFSKTPAPPSENMWGVSAQKSPMYQMEAQTGSLWDLHASKMPHQDLGTPAQMKGPGLTIPSSKTPAPTKGATPLSDSLWDSVMAAKHAPQMEQSVSFAPTTPTMAPMSAAHSYISPVFVEMEDDSFPRLDDPLPDNVVEESVRQFHAAAAEVDIELRRQMLSGKLDDEEMEQLVTAHLSQIEHSARNIVEQWNKARQAELERLEQEAEKQRIIEEQKRMLAEAKKNGRKKWGLSSATPAPEPTPAPAQPKKKGRRGTIQQEALAEAQELARVATPVGKPAKQAIIQDDAAPPDTFWKASNKAAGLASSLKGKLSAPSPPTPAPAPTARAGSTKPSSSILNPFASNVPKQQAPELSPWEAMMAKKKEALPEPSWGEPEDVDSSEGGSSFWESALGQAKGGAASAWGFFSGGQPEQHAPPPSKAASPPVVAPIPSVPTNLDSFWPSENNYATGIPRGATPAVSGFGAAQAFGGPPTDPRFATWRPQRMPDPEESTDPAKKMADLALENLLDITSTDEYSRPDDIFNAMSMYTKASTSASRKRGAR